MTTNFMNGFADEISKNAAAKEGLAQSIAQAIRRKEDRARSAQYQAKRGAGLKGKVLRVKVAMPSPDEAAGFNPLIGGLAGYLAQGNPDETPRSGFWRGTAGGLVGGAGGAALGNWMGRGGGRIGRMAAIGTGSTLGQVLGGLLGGYTARLNPAEREAYMARKIHAYLAERDALRAKEELADAATKSVLAKESMASGSMPGYEGGGGTATHADRWGGQAFVDPRMPRPKMKGTRKLAAESDKLVQQTVDDAKAPADPAVGKVQDLSQDPDYGGGKGIKGGKGGIGKLLALLAAGTIGAGVYQGKKQEDRHRDLEARNEMRRERQHFKAMLERRGMLPAPESEGGPKRNKDGTVGVHKLKFYGPSVSKTEKAKRYHGEMTERLSDPKKTYREQKRLRAEPYERVD